MSGLSRLRLAVALVLAFMTTARMRPVVAALRPRPAGRPVPWIVLKRNDLRVGRTYGHWWLELDGGESYGWWPARTPLRLRDFLLGVGGSLNGPAASTGGTLWRDLCHGEASDHAFHPVALRCTSDWQLRRRLRSEARKAGGEWRWRLRGRALNCRTFQLRLLAAAQLSDAADLSSRGKGCPFLRPLRRAGLLRPYRLWSESASPLP